jgi:tRNA pseudouridine55 synthase
MADEKAYRATVRLGITTDTYDLDGDVTAEADASHVSELDVRTAMAPLTGHILQLPPMYSALKVDGQPLYKHARRGDEVLREPREVHIKRMDMIHYASPDVELEIVCSKGTYIRTLAFDLGQALGCGATLAGLRRTRSGQFDIANAIPLEDLQPTNAMGLDHMLANLPVLALGDADAERFGNGARLPVDDDRTGLVRVTATDGATLGVAEVDAGTLYPRKVLPQS